MPEAYLSIIVTLFKSVWWQLGAANESSGKQEPRNRPKHVRKSSFTIKLTLHSSGHRLISTNDTEATGFLMRGKSTLSFYIRSRKQFR